MSIHIACWNLFNLTLGASAAYAAERQWTKAGIYLAVAITFLVGAWVTQP